MKKTNLKFLLLSIFVFAFTFSNKANTNNDNSVVDIIVNSENHTTLEDAVIAAELVTTLQGDGPFTVFAPTDDAFDALPDGLLDDLLADPTGDLADILLYHVVAGQSLSTDLTDGQVITTVLGQDITVTINDDGVFINDAQVTAADLEADNGVVHVIDAVLVPELLPETVVDIIVESVDHNTLETAVVEADLVETLQGEGPFTVFAPTDAAFDALPDGLLDDLLDDPTGDLTDILLYHVVAGQSLSTDLTDGQVIETVLGEDVTVTINNDGGIFINDAEVTIADLEAENGVVHVIDAVLVPEPSVDVQIMIDDTFGQIITDADGNTLYFFTPDADGSSNCVDGCLDNWPLFYADDIIIGEGLDEDDFSSIDRGDGVMQTTYKGWPLYYFANDNEAGDTNGDGVIGKWFVAKPDYTVMLVDNQLTGLDGVNYTGDYTEDDEIIQHLVDDYGFTLYTWVNDYKDRNMFTAEDFSNNGAWPVYDEDEIIVPSNLSVSDFNVIDVFGTDQMTYNGWPLYFFGQDDARGETKGVSVPVPGIWPVAVPDMDMAPDYTVVDIVINSDVHTTLETAVVEADLVETLQGDGPFTVFAPTDDAFDALPEGLLDDLLDDPTGDLADILLYHVVAGQSLSTDLTDGQVIETVLGQDITVTTNDDGVFINDAQVTTADLEAENGVVHVIDAVLVPELIPATVVDIIVNSDVHTTLETAVVEADLVETLQGDGPFTVFAPTDAAFDALPDGLLDDLLTDPTGDLADILLYHVVAGQSLSTDLTDGQVIETVLGQDITVTINDDGVFINDAQVTTADLEAENGVVHVIDAVLVPELIPATVVDIIVNSDVHNTLETAVIEAGLVETLQGEGPFTVFAPTDDAFAALPDGLLDDLLTDPTGDLADILLYHVVAGQSLSTDLTDGQVIETVLGQDITVTINDDGVFINDAQVILADLEAENGVVHVIDAVLIFDTNVESLAGQTANLNVFPNPVRDNMNLTFEMQSAENVVIEIFNIAGVKVFSIDHDNASDNVNIDVSDLSQGTYILNIRNQNEVITRKINVVR